MNFSLVVAVDLEKGIGKNNDLIWDLPTDRKYFKKTTVVTENSEKINAVIMGRKTWVSIPKKFRPLNGRLNFVLSRDCNYTDEGCVTGSSLDEILEIISLNSNIENIFIIGGSHLYNQVLSDSRLEKIYLTQLEGDFNCDVFFDGVPDNFKLSSESEKFEENNIKFQFKIFQKK